MDIAAKASVNVLMTSRYDLKSSLSQEHNLPVFSDGDVCALYQCDSDGRGGRAVSYSYFEDTRRRQESGNLKAWEAPRQIGNLPSARGSDHHE